jgi:hypothetical protein
MGEDRHHWIMRRAGGYRRTPLEHAQYAHQLSDKANSRSDAASADARDALEWISQRLEQARQRRAKQRTAS